MLPALCLSPESPRTTRTTLSARRETHLLQNPGRWQSGR